MLEKYCLYCGKETEEGNCCSEECFQSQKILDKKKEQGFTCHFKEKKC